MAGVMCPDCLELDGEHSKYCPKVLAVKPEAPPVYVQDSWYYTTPAWDVKNRTMCRIPVGTWSAMSREGRREAFMQFFNMTPTPVIPGVGADEKTVENPDGGRQSASPYRCDLVPPMAFLRCAMVRKHGADKYGEGNDKMIPSSDNLNHALAHVFAWLAGDRRDDHPGHAVTRIMMWYDALVREGKVEIETKPAQE